MTRFKELKYEGQTYDKEFKIKEILIECKLGWVLDAEMSDARIEIINNTLVWNAGTWYNGTWKYGVFRSGEWRYGIWDGGVWYNGTWRNGIFKRGIIFNGKFLTGQFIEGDIRGGHYIDVDISPNVKIDANNVTIHVKETIKKFSDFIKQS